MSAKAATVPLPRLTGGVNRFTQEAEAEQCAEALDVIEDEGEIRRRPAFHAVATSAPFLIPAGLSQLALYDGESYDFADDRAGTAGASLFDPAGGAVLVGCERPFDGFDWRHVTSTLGDQSENYFLGISYWNDSAWVALDEIVDTTWGFIPHSSNGNKYIAPLIRDGRVSWHRSLMTGWAAQTLSGGTRSLYYVRIDIYDSSGAASGFEGIGTLTIDAPGVRPFELAPVRSIQAFRSKAGRSALIVGSDRRSRSGSENGSALGLVTRAARETEVARLIADEGAGTMGRFVQPGVSTASPGEEWPNGAWTTGSSPGSVGTADTLVKNRVDYSWTEEQFRGGVVARSIAPVANLSQSAWQGSFDFNALGRQTTLRANAWEHFRIRCVTNGSAAGTPVGEEKEVIATTAPDGSNRITVRYADPFSIDPDLQNRFDILRPHHQLKLSGSTRLYEILTVESSTAHGIEVVDGEVFAPDLDSADNDRFVHWSVVQELRWLVDSGRFWTGALDMTTRKQYLTNGGDILAWDGRHFRRLAATSDESNRRVQAWVGGLPDQARDELSNRALAGSKLEARPPRGKLIVDFRGRTVVAELQGRPYDVQWSAPAPDSDIWPRMYRTQIRSAENDTISAMWVQQDVCFVSTPTTIHGAFPPDDTGFLIFRPIHHGAGFVSHRSVCALPDGRTIGVTADGVSIFDGTSMIQVLDEWRRLLPNGVNAAKLKDAVGAVSYADNRYYLALSSEGDNDRVLVFDLESRRWWVWSAPWGGITAIARDFDDGGAEQIVFGTADGHLAVLRGALTDDGSVITGFARSRTMQLDKDLETMAPTDVVIQAHETGAQTISLRVFLDQFRHVDAGGGDSAVSFSPAQTPTMELDDNTFELDDAACVLGGGRLVTEKIPIGDGSRCESFAYEVRGTGQWVMRAAALKAGRFGGHRSVP